MSNKASRKTKNRDLDPRLAGLTEPSDPPPPLPHEKPQARVELHVRLRIVYAILAHCFLGDEFSMSDLFRELTLHKDDPRFWLEAVRLCGKDDDGMNLWMRDGFFLPCRENAGKAVQRIQGWFLSATADQLGFQDVPALVVAINALPSGLEVMARGCQPRTAETEDE